jgi:glycosyltransferase 2 family protein
LGKKKIFKLLIRVTISIIVIAFLLHNADVMQTIKSLLRTDIRVWVSGIFLYILGQSISAYKWKLLASAAGYQKKFKDYLNFYFIGMFFNLFLPTTVGGDVIKGYYLSKDDPEGRKAPAIYSILADRFTGVAVIVLISTIACLSPVGNPVPAIFKIFLFSFSAAIIIFTPIFPTFLHTFFKRKKLTRSFLKDTKSYWTNPKLMTTVFLWSLIFHITVVMIHIIIGHALQLNIPFAYYFIVYPISAIAGFIPFTFNGIGPREAAYVLFFHFIGISHADAVAFGLLWLGIVICSSLFGGIFYIRGKHIPPVKELEDEEEEFNLLQKAYEEDASAEVTDNS